MCKRNGKTKLLSLLAAGLLALPLLLGALAGLNNGADKTALAASPVAQYYYSQLDDSAKKFYGAIAEMEKQGVLKTGVTGYDLCANGVLSQADLAAYGNNPSAALMSFGAARDAYILDNPDVFYVDFSRLSVRAGYKTADGGKIYTASLGTGRADSYYYAEEGALKSVAAVDDAVAAFGTAKAAIVNGAKDLETDYEKVKYVNKAIVNKNEYSFGYTEQGAVDAAAYPFVHTSYGALVKGKSVCEGYARSFKSVLDELGIPCVLIQGYAATGAAYEPHMWNAVQLEGNWYGVDVTWNDTTRNETRYLLRSASEFASEHKADGIISEANYQFRYPALCDTAYGTEITESGIAVRTEYNAHNGVTMLETEVSYDGMGAAKLETTRGLFLAVRQGAEDSGDIAWGPWTSLSRGEAVFGGAIQNADTHTVIQIHPQIEFVQFAIIRTAPNNRDSVSPYFYTEGTVTAESLAAKGDFVQNAAYGTYAAPPYVRTMEPSAQAVNDVLKTHSVKIVYGEKLKLVDAQKPADVTVTASSPDAEKYSVIKDFRWDGDSTVTFTFTGSPMFELYQTYYYFTLVNLVGETSEKRPNAACLALERQSFVCSKCMDNGGLYMDIFGKPTLLADRDLSETEFTDENGNVYAEGMRSQLLLVAGRTNAADTEAMLAGARDNAGVQNSDVLASETYEINLNICGKITRIPEGSYMKLGLGFPAGYGPDDAGVTFKVYHFKRGADGKIDTSRTEEIACVVTPYGLVVTVDSFSPFAVVAVKSEAVSATDKSVYVRGSDGGSVSVDGANNLFALHEGGSAVIRFAPDAGYTVESVRLNGESVSVTGNTLAVEYANLRANNTVDVSFVAAAVLTKETAEGITAIMPAFTVADPMGRLSVSLSPTAKVKAGSSITLRAAAVSENARVQADISYAWYKEGALVGTGESLTIDKAKSADAGEYTVVVGKAYEMRTITARAAVSLTVRRVHTELIVGLILGAVVVIGGGALAVAYFRYRKKSGGSKAGQGKANE